MLSNPLKFRVWFDFAHIDRDSQMIFYLLIDQWEYGPYFTNIQTKPCWVEKPTLHPRSVPSFSVDQAMALAARLCETFINYPVQGERMTGSMILERSGLTVSQGEGGPVYDLV